MSIKTIIIDCKGDIIREIAEIVNKHLPELAIVGIAANCKSGFKLAHRFQAEVIILRVDNHSPELTKQIQLFTEHARIVIINSKTNRKQHLNANGVIETSKSNLVSQIQKLLIELSNKNSSFAPIERIGVPSGFGTKYIPTNQIIYFQADNNYTLILQEDLIKTLVSKPLKRFEIKLANNNFLRTHQSYLVNLKKVKEIANNDGGFLVMVNNHKVPISRSKKALVKDKLNDLFQRI